VNALEWIVILELVVLGLVGVLEVVSIFIARQDPNDPVAVFCRTFWREFLRPPLDIPINPARYIPGEGGGIAGHPQPTDDDEFYGRIPKSASGRVDKVDLPILVEPHGAADQVVGRDGDGIKVRVTGEAGESRANKALIEMIANAIGVKPYQVTLTKGHYQTLKAVQIQGLSAEQLQDKLAELPEAE
jgi:uncharacterized protein YggU (UPF0235/DUF167 family)